MSKLKIAASLLAGDFLNIKHELERIKKSGIDLIHMDVMDGHYVPEITFGSQMIRAVIQATDLPVDVHLAITNADSSIDRFVSIRPRCIFIHPETSYMPIRLLKYIADAGIVPGIAIHPAYSINSVRNLVECVTGKCDILLMSVEPGFGGQSIITQRIQLLKELRTFVHGQIWVDGGIDPYWSQEARRHGADGVVSGTSVFNSGNPMELSVELLRGEA